MESLCFKAGIHGISSSSNSVTVGLECRTHPAQVSAIGRSANGGVSLENSTDTIAPQRRLSSSGLSLIYPLRFPWKGNVGFSLEEPGIDVGNGDVERGEEVDFEGRENEGMEMRERRGNWVLKILRVNSIWREKGKSGVDELEKEDDVVNDLNDGCSCCDEEESRVGGVCEEEVEFDQASFSRFLRRVSLAEAKLYAQMSYLGKLAYSVSKIKPGNLLKYQGLRLVTSSMEKKAQLMEVAKKLTSEEVKKPESNPKEVAVEDKEESKKNGYRLSAYSAYQIAASAASYVHSHTSSMLPFNSSKAETLEDLPSEGSKGIDKIEITSSEVASFVATTNSMTAVVAAKEEMKKAVVEDLNSAQPSPCEWFICDDDQSGTRFFVIQGSESLSSWQANLLFEPIQFEELDVLVHRGIYELAKGIYEQILPEVHAHLISRGNYSKFRFTGHSLGGSLSLLINLMLLIRGVVPRSSLLPVIMFGAPSIMCGGDQLLRKLGLTRSHVQAIMIHRDIVPRAFSCNYPDHVAEILKAINGNFRRYPCLNNQKLLYAPMGELLILQPEEKFSPHHHLLPCGSGFYLLSYPTSESDDGEKQFRAARRVFLNSPHPLEILSDRSAYGSNGTIYRDHDMNSYFRAVRGVIRQELNQIRKASREDRRQVWWPLVAPRGVVSSNTSQNQLNFSGVIHTGTESLKRFTRLVSLQHMRLFDIGFRS